MTDVLRILEIDLTKKEATIVQRPDLAHWLGGTGLALALFAETEGPELPIGDPGQPIVFAIGPMTFVYPVVTKTVAVFRSPLTGEYGESHAGGRLAMALRHCDLSALVIKGEAEGPLWLEINNGHVSFKNAEPLWGTGCSHTGRRLRDLTQGRSFRSIIRIGPAGENKVAFAGVNVDTFRHFGRLGLGACFGYKKLKGIVVTGDLDNSAVDLPKYRKVYNRLYQKTVRTDLMKKYHDLGTAVNVLPLNAMKALPTLNMQSGSFAEAEAISGEKFAENHLIRKLACSGCPIGCIHIALLRQEFASGHEYVSSEVAYDYELIFALGSYLGISSPSEILALIDTCEQSGLDVIASGIVAGWATEASVNGLINPNELKIELSFGEVKGYRQLFEYISRPQTTLHRDMGRGVRFLGEKYGGAEYAMHVAGNEMPGYFTGYGYLLGVGAGARHSHLDNGGYAFDQEMQGDNDNLLVEKIIAEDQRRGMLTSLCICLFARKIYDDDDIVDALGALGYHWNTAALSNLGEQIFKQKHLIRQRMGITGDLPDFPRRFFETECLLGKLDAQRMQDIWNLWLEKTGF
jgi:aldehyde:ferredoxin oxidoreductase